MVDVPSGSQADRVSPGPVSGRRPAAAGPARRPRQLWPYAFIAPAVLAMGLGFGFPLVSVVRNSFFAGTLQELHYVGLGNYQALFDDQVFRTSLANNLRLLLAVPVMTLIALLLALLINDGIRGWRFYRSAVFLPYILPSVGTGLAFSVFLSFNGALNTFLRSVHLGALARDWLGSPDFAIYSVGGVVIWQQLGFGVVIFTAALLSLPGEVTEAALLDGLNWWQLQLKVHIPQIRPAIEFFVVTEAITVLSWVFAYVYVLTGGGPANSSMVMEFYVWKQGFSIGAVGLANAAAVVIMLMAVVLILAYLSLRLKADSEDRR